MHPTCTQTCAHLPSTVPSSSLWWLPVSPRVLVTSSLILRHSLGVWCSPASCRSRDWRCRELLLPLPLFQEPRLFHDTFTAKYFHPRETEPKHPMHVNPSSGSSGEILGSTQAVLGTGSLLGAAPGAVSVFRQLSAPGLERSRCAHRAPRASWGRGARGTAAAPQGEPRFGAVLVAVTGGLVVG